MRKLLLTLALAATALGAQTKIDLTQLPGCQITSSTPANVPIILAIVPTPNGQSNFACYAVTGATVTAATATSPASIIIPTPPQPISVTAEVPAGTIDGTNATFTLANTPIAGSIKLYKGLRMTAGVDYTASGNTITFKPGAIPQPGDVLVADYEHN